jgi:hypothetical protein
MHPSWSAVGSTWYTRMAFAVKVFIREASRLHWAASVRGSASVSWYAIPSWQSAYYPFYVAIFVVGAEARVYL